MWKEDRRELATSRGVSLVLQLPYLLQQCMMGTWYVDPGKAGD